MTKYINELMIFLEIEKRVIKGCDEVYKELGIDIWEAFCEKYVKKGGCCDNCKNARFVAEYPEFTPAKQLELIKLICRAKKFGLLDIDLCPSGEGEERWMFIYRLYDNPPELRMEYERFAAYGKGFENTLSKIIILLINKNILDKAAVKRILEDE